MKSHQTTSALLYIGAAICFFMALGVLVLPRSHDQYFNLPESSQVQAKQEPVLSQEERTSKWISHGETLEAKGDIRGAIAAYATAFEENPEHIYALTKQIYLHKDLFELQQALEKTDRLLELDQSPTEQALHDELTLMSLSSPDERNRFIDELSTRIQAFADTEVSYAYLGCVISLYTRNQTYLEHMCRLAEDHPNGTISNFARTARLDEAAYDTFKDADESYILTLHAKNLLSRKFVYLAKDLLIDATKKQPEYRDAHLLLGYAYYLMRDYANAKESLEYTYQLDTTKAYTQFLLGATHEALSEYEQARTFYELALQNQYSERTTILEKLVSLYQRAELYDKAIEYQILLLAEDGSTNIMRFVPAVEMSIDYLDDPDTALGLSRKAEAAHPGNSISAYLLGRSLLAQNKPSEALPYLETSTKNNQQTPTFHFYLAEAYRLLDRKDDAKRSYETVIQLDRSSVFATRASSALTNL